MVLGLAAEAYAWWLISFRGRSVWAVMTPVLAGLGGAALLAGPPAWSPRVDAAAAVLLALGTGALLYLATRTFVTLVRRWGAFREQSIGMYLRRGRLSLPGILLLSVVLMVPGEELFWRGVFQVEAASVVGGRTLGAVVTWGAFVVANLPSGNLAILAGGVVGGAVWTALGWWSGGALAPLVCHGVWTSLMLAFPVVRRAEAAT